MKRSGESRPAKIILLQWHWMPKILALHNKSYTVEMQHNLSPYNIYIQLHVLQAQDKSKQQKWATKCILLVLLSTPHLIKEKKWKHLVYRKCEAVLALSYNTGGH